VSIIVSYTKGDYTPAPEGLHQAVCIDVVDLGIKATQWGDKHKVQIRWALEERDPKTDRAFLVTSQYTMSLHKKAQLRQQLEAWRGRKFTEEELKGFDLEKLIGVNCQLQVVHNLGDEGSVFANVQAVVPLGKGMAKLPIPEGYVRVADRDDHQPPQRQAVTGPMEADLDPTPF
jgi:hypothetical protein